MNQLSRSSLFKAFFAILMSFSSLYGAEISQKPIVVIIPSYNNSDWFEENLNSVLTQDYKNYRVIYINDKSRDDTGQKVEEYLSNKNVDYRVINFDDQACQSISEAKDLFAGLVNADKTFFILVNNVNRCGALANLYRSILSCNDGEIIATVDGDDWLLHPQVLKQLNTVYRKNIWLTHGNLMEYPSGAVGWCEPVPQNIIRRNAFREFKCPSHLRTFYAWLFKKIKLEDLLYDGNFFVMTWDMAIMFPMIEMAGKRHAFIEEPNYVYNIANQINDNKVNAELQQKLDAYIRNKERYQKI